MADAVDAPFLREELSVKTAVLQRGIGAAAYFSISLARPVAPASPSGLQLDVAAAVSRADVVRYQGGPARPFGSFRFFTTSPQPSTTLPHPPFLLFCRPSPSLLLPVAAVAGSCQGVPLEDVVQQSI